MMNPTNTEICNYIDFSHVGSIIPLKSKYIMMNPTNTEIYNYIVFSHVGSIIPLKLKLNYDET